MGNLLNVCASARGPEHPEKITRAKLIVEQVPLPKTDERAELLTAVRPIGYDKIILTSDQEAARRRFGM
jgi:hypothetical protein